MEEIKEVTSMFLDIAYKVKNAPLNIKNVVFTRLLEFQGNNEIKEMYNVEAIADKGVGIATKKGYDSRKEIIINSYFLDEKSIKDFIYSSDKSIENLYNVWL